MADQYLLLFILLYIIIQGDNILIVTENDIVVYENKIEELFLEFYSLHGIDPDKDGIKLTKVYGSWRYIHNLLFKPDPNSKAFPIDRRFNSNIDYSDIDTLYLIAESYLYICETYGIDPTRYGFSLLIGVSRQVIDEWAKGNVKQYIYINNNNRINNTVNIGNDRYTSDTNIINATEDNNIYNTSTTYSSNNNVKKIGGYRGEEDITSAYKNLVKMLDDGNREFIRSRLAEDRTGVIARSNHDKEDQLLYEHQNYQEQRNTGIAVEALADLSARRRGLLPPPKPDLSEFDD